MIHILPPEVANRIAAGEVVERPASAVRELIDNAIDAGATRIDVEIERGGLGSIRVADNGGGMSSEDAVLCVKRHATSKILSAKDLDSIQTKGFRGEALAAISSVSRFELRTRRPEDEFGTLIQIEGAGEPAPKKTGAAAGTVVTIRDLFFNTPARLKFLKKPSTEQGHVLSTITWNALAHENVHFTFTNNGRRTLDLPATAARPERVKQIFGNDILEELIPVHVDSPLVSISGLISRPTLTRNSTQHIFFYVNNRYIKDRLLHRALMDGYRNLIPSSRFPVAFLFYELDTAEIDINVHPTKQEIKFSHERAIFSATYGAVRQVWDTREEAKEETKRIFDTIGESKTRGGVKPGPEPENRFSDPPQNLEAMKRDALLAEEETPRREEKTAPVSSVESSQERLVEESTTIDSSAPVEFNRESIPSRGDESAHTLEPEPAQAVELLNRKPLMVDADAAFEAKESLRENLEHSGLSDLLQEVKKPDELFAVRSLEDAGALTVLGQLLDSYILAQGSDGLYIIDQHAAHERILFDRFLVRSQQASLASQSLLFPLTFDFSPEEMVLLGEMADEITRLGIDMEPFGPQTYVCRAVPNNLGLDEVDSFIRDLMGEWKLEGTAQEKRERALRTLACRAAIKFGDRLKPDEMEGVIRELEKIPRRNVCPHGRPSILFISDDALRRSFKRTGFS